MISFNDAVQKKAASNWVLDHGSDLTQGPLGLTHGQPVAQQASFVQGKGLTGHWSVCNYVGSLF